MQSNVSPRTRPTGALGVAVSTSLKGGIRVLNHSEGVVVSTSLKGGIRVLNHSEGVVVRGSVKDGGAS